MATVDYEHELNNGWDKWQNLVLTALKENRDASEKMAQDIEEIKIQQAVATEATKAIKEDIQDLKTTSDRQDTRIEKVNGRVDKMELGKAALRGGWVTVSILGTVLASCAGLTMAALAYFG